MAWVELSALVKSCARPYHSGCFFQQRWSHKPQMELFRQRPHTAARARNQMKTCHEIGNWKCDKSGIGNATNPGAEKCWCVACGRRRRLFHSRLCWQRLFHWRNALVTAHWCNWREMYISSGSLCFDLSRDCCAASTSERVRRMSRRRNMLVVDRPDFWTKDSSCSWGDFEIRTVGWNDCVFFKKKYQETKPLNSVNIYVDPIRRGPCWFCDDDDMVRV